MNIKARLVGKGAIVYMGGVAFDLTEEDVRRMRAELNRVLQKIHEKRSETINE